jgi:hypothetical protein
MDADNKDASTAMIKNVKFMAEHGIATGATPEERERNAFSMLHSNEHEAASISAISNRLLDNKMGDPRYSGPDAVKNAREDAVTQYGAIRAALRDLGAAPAAVKPAPQAAPAGGAGGAKPMPTFRNQAAVNAAKAAGQIKAGQPYMDPAGNQRTVQ